MRSLVMMSRLPRFAYLISIVVICVSAETALADLDGPNVQQETWSAGGTINEGQSVGAFLQLRNYGETNSGGFAGTTTHRFNGNTLSLSAPGSTSGGANVGSNQNGDIFQNFGTAFFTYQQDGNFTISFSQNFSHQTTENSSYGLGTNNITWASGHSNSAAVTVLNVAPTITQAQLNGVNGNITVNEGAAVNAFMQSTDPGADFQTYQFEGTPLGTVSGGTGGNGAGSTRSSSNPSIGNYTQDGVFGVTFRVFDDDTNTALGRTVTVNNVAPTILSANQNGTNGNITVNEGSTVNLDMSSTDPGADAQTFVINGIGQGVGGTTPGSTRTSTTQTVTYNQQGVVGNSFDVYDDDTVTSTGRTVTILNVAPTVLAANQNGTNGDITVNEGTVVSLDMSSTDPGQDFQSFFINAVAQGVGGDTPGSTRTSTTQNVAYNQQGSFSNTYEVFDDQTSTSTSRNVTVNNVLPQSLNLVLSSNTINEGDSITASISATDPGADAITFTIEGNAAGVDGNTTPGSTRNSNVVGLGPYYQSGVSPSAYTIDGDATDDVGTSSTSQLLTVLNVAPTILTLTGGGVYIYPTPVNFSVSWFDPGIFDVVTATWDWDNDSQFDDFVGASGVIPAGYFAQNSTNLVTVQLDDGDGGIITGSFIVTMIPEPGSVIVWSLLGACFAAGGWLKHRKRRSA
jgi:hypothetical protein